MAVKMNARRVQSPAVALFSVGLSLTACALSHTAHAQASGQTAPPTLSPSPSPSASGGLMGQLGRELSDILLQNRDGVVTIRGHRTLILPVAFGGGKPLPPGAASALPGSPVILPVIGSGFLVQGGIVVTTAEVAEDIINPVVILPNGRHLRVTAKNLDKNSNLAILKVADGETLLFLRLGESATVLPGSLAVTIGTQAGFSTSGGLAFIAQTGRQARSGERVYKNLIQFQGAVGPGSSGSPLCGATGEVIGIVMAAPDLGFGPGMRGGWPGMGGAGGNRGGRRPDEERHSPEHFDKGGHGTGLNPHKPHAAADTTGNSSAAEASSKRPAGEPSPDANGMPPRGGGLFFNPFGGLSNIGFALPIDDLKNRLEGLVRTAQAIPAPGWLGLRVEGGSKPGAYVSNLYDGSPADHAGLEVGDIITQIDGHPIRSKDDFFMWLLQGVENQTMRLQLQRGAETRAISVRLRARPEESALREMPLRVPLKVGVWFVPRPVFSA